MEDSFLSKTRPLIKQPSSVSFPRILKVVTAAALPHNIFAALLNCYHHEVNKPTTRSIPIKFHHCRSLVKLDPTSHSSQSIITTTSCRPKPKQTTLSSSYQVSSETLPKEQIADGKDDLLPA